MTRYARRSKPFERTGMERRITMRPDLERRVDPYLYMNDGDYRHLVDGVIVPALGAADVALAGEQIPEVIRRRFIDRMIENMLPKAHDYRLELAMRNQRDELGQLNIPTTFLRDLVRVPDAPAIGDEVDLPTGGKIRFNGTDWRFAPRDRPYL
jgi:hypothetical protein